jgi:hypothetical protein
MITLAEFKKVLKVDSIELNQFTKGSRAFAIIKVGEEEYDIYIKENVDVDKPLFVSENEKGFFVHNAKEIIKTIRI